MITGQESARIEKEVNGLFPDVKVKHSVDAASVKLSFTVPKITTVDFLQLSLLVSAYDVQIEVKRSGTGLSVHLN